MGTNNTALIIGGVVTTIILCTVLILLLLAMIWSNTRKQNKLIQKNNETLERILLNQTATIAQQQNYNNYQAAYWQPYQYQQQNISNENRAVYNNPYIKNPQK